MASYPDNPGHVRELAPVAAPKERNTDAALDFLDFSGGADYTADISAVHPPVKLNRTRR